MLVIQFILNVKLNAQLNEIKKMNKNFELIGKNLKIKNLKDFEKLLKEKKEFKLVNSGLNTLSITYKVFNKKTFDTELALEARGICFEKQSGNIISRPLHKFHNVGEHVILEDIDFSNLLAIWNKLDGSMISLVNIDGQIVAKSKSSFLGMETSKVNKFIGENTNYAAFCFEIGVEFTPIFEYIDPENRIVIDYKKEDLVFLHLRHNESGKYVPFNDVRLQSLLMKYNISHQEPLSFNNKNSEFDLALLNNYIKTSNLEGVVLQFNDGEMLKYKTEFYQKRTLRSRKELREREVVKLFLDGKLDDKKGQLRNLGYNIEPIETFENKLLSDLLSVEKEIADNAKVLTQLNESEKIDYINNVLSQSELRNMIIRKAKNQRYDIYDYFMKKRLKTYSLDLIELKK